MGSSILIVDDNLGLAYFTAYSLKQELEGLTIVTAGSCEEANLLADTHHPSVAIVDLNLPDGNGLELIADLKKRFLDVKPILITASEVDSDLYNDEFGVLIKPYDPQELIDLVRNALSGYETGENVSERHDWQETDSPSARCDFHHVRNRLSGLLTGLRALRLEVIAVANDPSEVRRTIDEYADRLSEMVKDVAEELRRKT